MQKILIRGTGRVLALAGLVAAAACSDANDAAITTTDPGTSVGVGVGVGGSPAHHRLARLLAVSLRDDQVRERLRQDMAASPVKEGKLQLRSYLNGRGQGLLMGMARAASASNQEVLGLVNQVGPMEIYLPSQEFRSGWDGGSDLIVGTTMDERETGLGVHLNGRTVQIPRGTLPEVTTLSLVPAESFDAAGEPLQRDLAGPGSAISTNLMLTGWTGLWVTEVHIADKCNFECGLNGDPEFEMWLERADDRSKIACQDQDQSIAPFRWNMDGNDYYTDFLLQEDVKIPAGVKMVVSMWEDDKDRCILKPEDSKDYVKLSVDLITSANGAYKAYKEKGILNDQTVVLLSHAYMALRYLTDSGDDFVGVSSGNVDITGAETRVSLSNHNGTTVGWMMLQYATK
jgi:hypothetical protein